MSKDYASIASAQVLMGCYIPANDELFDIAEEIGKQVAAFHAYISSARSEEQADSAVKELLGGLIAGKLKIATE